MAELARVAVVEVEFNNLLLCCVSPDIFRDAEKVSPAPHLGSRGQRPLEEGRLGHELFTLEVPFDVAADDLNVPLTGRAGHVAELAVNRLDHDGGCGMGKGRLT